MRIHRLSTYVELKKSYQIPAAILAASVGFYLAGTIYELPNMSLLVRVGIVISPVLVSVACFLTMHNYGHSRIFGKSYALLGIGYMATFVGEMVFFYYVDHLLLREYIMLGDMLIFSSYPFMVGHILINIRYFAHRFEAFQKLLFVVVLAVIFCGYSLILYGASLSDPSSFYYYLVFVSASSVVLGLAVIAFTVFRHTALASAWRVLLVGIALGTVGDILYNHASTLGVYDFGDFSNILWIASSPVMVYALYMHRQSM